MVNYTLFYKQRQAEIGKKIKQNLSNTPRLNFCYLKVIHILHPRYRPELIGHILKNNIHEIIGLIIVKMKMKMKNGSHIYDINSPSSRHIVNIGSVSV